MSRIGKLPINIPVNVEIKYENSEVIIKGKFGKLSIILPAIIKLSQNNNILKIEVEKEIKNGNAFQGLYRTLINNMIIGVSKQFEVILILKGVGYRASVQGNELILNLGYSHPIKIKIPENISIEIIQTTTLNLKSCDKELLGLFASNIRTWRKPEPYKGKGILYKNEQILRKDGKSAK
uniref:Ribosomal protein L6 n=1 Tax=Climaconeis cf. scalaris TaxID=2846828 RepID=A0A8F8SRA0_9STRA|nr:ribosomal protein L6 [Climaconeis cf. scalaris]QYB19161.1 ribosomal protein L6 [Climaconeis cf. scalaris]